jgi:GGDEF domain-containing protein
MDKKTKIVLGTRNEGTYKYFSSILEPLDYVIILARNKREIFERIFFEIPSIIFLDWTSEEFSDPAICDELKQNIFLSQTPLIILISKEKLDSLRPEEVTYEDFIILPGGRESIILRCSLALLRSVRELDANPLTKLPGNNRSVQEIERRLKGNEPFAFALLDLDNFKAYNDKYGFQRGDEAIKMTARVIVNTLQGLNDPKTFIGHIGGDDFVLAVSTKNVDRACKGIIDNFSQVIPSLYDDEDVQKGFIISRDRQGQSHKYDVMTISIAVIDLSKLKISHFGELSSIMGELKKVAKRKRGNAIVKNRRIRSGFGSSKVRYKR